MVTTEFVTDEPGTMVAFIGVTVAADTPAEGVANVAVGCRSIGRGELVIVDHVPVDRLHTPADPSAGEGRVPVRTKIAHPPPGPVAQATAARPLHH